MLRPEAAQDALQDLSGLLVSAPLVVCTTWMVRCPSSTRMRVTNCRDLYDVSFLLYLSRSMAAAAIM